MRFTAKPGAMEAFRDSITMSSIVLPFRHKIPIPVYPMPDNLGMLQQRKHIFLVEEPEQGANGETVPVVFEEYTILDKERHQFLSQYFVRARMRLKVVADDLVDPPDLMKFLF